MLGEPRDPHRSPKRTPLTPNNIPVPPTPKPRPSPVRGCSRLLGKACRRSGRGSSSPGTRLDRHVRGGRAGPSCCSARGTRWREAGPCSGRNAAGGGDKLRGGTQPQDAAPAPPDPIKPHPGARRAAPGGDRERAAPFGVPFMGTDPFPAPPPCPPPCTWGAAWLHPPQLMPSAAPIPAPRGRQRPQPRPRPHAAAGVPACLAAGPALAGIAGTCSPALFPFGLPLPPPPPLPLPGGVMQGLGAVLCVYGVVSRGGRGRCGVPSPVLGRVRGKRYLERPESALRASARGRGERERERLPAAGGGLGGCGMGQDPPLGEPPPAWGRCVRGGGGHEEDSGEPLTPCPCPKATHSGAPQIPAGPPPKGGPQHRGDTARPIPSSPPPGR